MAGAAPNLDPSYDSVVCRRATAVLSSTPTLRVAVRVRTLSSQPGPGSDPGSELMTSMSDQSLPSMSFVCLDHGHGGAMAQLRQGIRDVARQCPELRLVVLSCHCAALAVAAVEVTWLMEGSRATDLLPTQMEARAAALTVERRAAETLGHVPTAAFDQNLDTPTATLQLHVVLTADGADGVVLARPPGRWLSIAEATCDLFHQGDATPSRCSSRYGTAWS